MPYELTSALSRLGDEFTLIPLISEEDTDSDGHAEVVFGRPRTITGRVSSRGSSEYERAQLGQTEEVGLYLTVADDEDVSRDDRVLVNGGAYRVTQPMPALRNEFHRFALVEDDRVPASGPTHPGVGDDGDADDPDDPDDPDDTDGSGGSDGSDDGGSGGSDDGFTWN